MNISQRGLELIASFEGFSPVPYNDPAGHCTVGYGELLHYGPCTAAELARPPITEEQGKAQLAAKVAHYGDAVESLSRPLNQNEYDALTSLCYNIGVGGYARSSVRAAVNGGGDVCAELRRYVKGTNGVTYPGLVRRRGAECALFNEPVEEDDDMKSPYIAWVIGWGVFFIGPGGAHYVPKQSTVDELAALYQISPQPSVGMSPDAAMALGGK